MRIFSQIAVLFSLVLILSGCTVQTEPPDTESGSAALSVSSDTQGSAENSPAIQTGFIENQTLDDADETIHYSYYFPDNYDPAKTYPLIVTMPGYDRMWFGEDSAGSNIEWNGVQAWTKLSEPVILTVLNWILKQRK